MRKRHLFIGLLAVLLLATAAPATAAPKIVVERIDGGLSGREPLEDEGGGYPGCWRAYITASGSHWTSSSWSHHFNPLWCGNGSVVTGIDAGWHYQTTSGFYGPNGVSRWVISGCVGCPSIRLHAQARFSFNFMGWTSYFDNDQYITLYGSNGRIGP
jgi:hypothetical protein